MSFANGRLPASALAPIPGGRLRKDAAMRWNAMCIYLRARGRAIPMPTGPQSSYRDFAGQVAMRRMWCARGRCGNAAIPGFSNHGWGIAVDAGQAWICDTVPQFGFHKRFSDAPWEAWHRKWGGFGPQALPGPRVLRRGMSGHDVEHVKHLLHRVPRKGSPKLRYWRARWKADQHFGRRLSWAVKRFQRDHHLPADGAVGPKTLAAIKRAAT